ncbi:MAG TPA: hypothetical protein VH438_06840 [Gemmatimonadales bacterium]
MTLKLENSFSFQVGAYRGRKGCFFLRDQGVRAAAEGSRVVVGVLAVNRGKEIPALTIQLMIREQVSNASG